MLKILFQTNLYSNFKIPIPTARSDHEKNKLKLNLIEKTSKYLNIFIIAKKGETWSNPIKLRTFDFGSLISKSLREWFWIFWPSCDSRVQECNLPSSSDVVRLHVSPLTRESHSMPRSRRWAASCTRRSIFFLSPSAHATHSAHRTDPHFLTNNFPLYIYKHRNHRLIYHLLTSYIRIIIHIGELVAVGP